MCTYFWATGIALLVALPAVALPLEVCTRVTHISHGGEADHVDLGEGRVMWRDWWSQEGAATDFAIVDCDAGETLRFRTAEENMNARAPFDRTEDAMSIVARHESGARVFATLDRMASDLSKIVRDVAITVEREETCACAALYPELRGTKAEFRLDGL
ncbi:MAG: hypothetical protein AAGI36_07515 [Pseudomonadota bacterium]